MSRTIADVEEALLALDQHDRAAVISRDLRSLEPDSTTVEGGDVEAAWRSALRRRIDEVENGDVALLDVDRSHAASRDELAARCR